jgi:hypothetical protein
MHKGEPMHGRDCWCDHCSTQANKAHDAYTKEYRRNHSRGTDRHDEAMKKYSEVMRRAPSDFEPNR